MMPISSAPVPFRDVQTCTAFVYYPQNNLRGPGFVQNTSDYTLLSHASDKSKPLTKTLLSRIHGIINPLYLTCREQSLSTNLLITNQSNRLTPWKHRETGWFITKREDEVGSRSFRYIAELVPYWCDTRVGELASQELLFAVWSAIYRYESRPNSVTDVQKHLETDHARKVK